MATQLATIDPAAVPARAESKEQTHFQLMQRKAALYASSPLIPESLRQGGAQVALANCYIGLNIAERMGENELVVLQNIQVIKGKAGFSAQFMIARANGSGALKGRINWREKGVGDNLEVTAYATLADTGEEISFPCDMAMAKAEGWTSNPKYKSIPKLMLRYRSATFLVRLYMPDVMFGYHTVEEVEDVAFAEASTAQPLTSQMLIAQAEGADPETGEVGEGPDDTQRGEAHDGATEVFVAKILAANDLDECSREFQAAVKAYGEHEDFHAAVGIWKAARA